MAGQCSLASLHSASEEVAAMDDGDSINGGWASGQTTVSGVCGCKKGDRDKAAMCTTSSRDIWRAQDRKHAGEVGQEEGGSGGKRGQ